MRNNLCGKTKFVWLASIIILIILPIGGTTYRWFALNFTIASKNKSGLKTGSVTSLAPLPIRLISNKLKPNMWKNGNTPGNTDWWVAVKKNITIGTNGGIIVIRGWNKLHAHRL